MSFTFNPAVYDPTAYLTSSVASMLGINVAKAAEAQAKQLAQDAHMKRFAAATSNDAPGPFLACSSRHSCSRRSASRLRIFAASLRVFVLSS